MNVCKTPFRAGCGQKTAGSQNTELLTFSGLLLKEQDFQENTKLFLGGNN